MNRKYRLIFLTAFLIITIVLWNIEIGYYILYPFTILGTWFHEMAHGLTAIIMGAEFQRLQLYPNGSGLAQYGYSRLFLGNIGKALIAAAGPIGPTIAGTVFFYASTNKRSAKIILALLTIMLIISLLIWVRPTFGIGALIILIFAVILSYITIKGSSDIRLTVLQFLGVQAFASVYMSIGYLFLSGGNIGNSSFASDTQVMADNLILPHWIWAVLLLAFSVYLFYVSIKHVVRKS